KPKPKKVTIPISRDIKTNRAQREKATRQSETLSTPPQHQGIRFDAKKIAKVGQGSTIKGIKNVMGSILGRYAHLVQTTYDHRWIQPTGLSNRSVTVKIRVVISKDGSIHSTTILSSSGIPAMDRSITQVIERVKRIPEPPPRDTSLTQRTFVLNFNLK
ncbi:TonB C-terminal domain-containing protein, partial [Verrucomicrobia bacterium]|nr:TonB C-terminal domain-containing protein [Verrucomicrobiota bacterium]